MRAAIARLKNLKATGADGIAGEMLKHMGPAAEERLPQIVQRFWQERQLPEDWYNSNVVPLLKKGDSTDCDNYRGISMLSVPSKALAIIILERCRDWVHGQLLKQQAGFRPNRGCNDAIFSLRLLCEKAAERGIPLYLAMVDVSKAYYAVDRAALWDVLAARGLPEDLIAMLQCLYQDTHSCVHTPFGDSDRFSIETGLRQGGLEAPLLFNTFLDTIVRRIQPELQQLGVRVLYKIDGQLTEARTYTCAGVVWMLMYADDISLACDSPENLQRALAEMHEEFKQWGMRISVAKTKILVAGAVPNDSPALSSQLDEQQLNTVQVFKYLGLPGRVFTTDNSLDAEHSNRIQSAAGVFSKLQKIGFWKYTISLRLKMRIF